MLNPRTEGEISEFLAGAIKRIAPEVDPGSIDPNLSLRDQADLDSVDFLNLVVSVHEKLGIDIPEADYPRLVTLRGFITYLGQRMNR